MYIIPNPMHPQPHVVGNTILATEEFLSEKVVAIAEMFYEEHLLNIECTDMWDFIPDALKALEIVLGVKLRVEYPDEGGCKVYYA